MRRPVIFLLLAGVEALVAALVVYSLLKQKDSEVARAHAGTILIVVAAHDIPVGTKIGSDALKQATWPRATVPPGALVDFSSALGSIARADFIEDEPIVASRLIAADKTSGVLPLMIPADMRAMAVAVDEVADISGFVLPHTRVDVLLAIPGTGGPSAGRSKVILENVEVLAVAQTIERKDVPQPVGIVTLLVTPEEGERLALAAVEGRLHLALRGYGDTNTITTSGTDMENVLKAYSPEAPPVPVEQAVHFRVPLRRKRPPEMVEVIRNGTSLQAVRVGGPTAASPAPAEDPGDGDSTTTDGGSAN